MSSDTDAHAEQSGAGNAERLKERIYVTFTALAVMIAIESHGGTEPLEALVTLLITVLGTVLAVLVADVLAHMAVQERVLTGEEFRHAAQVSLGALGVVALPVAFLALGALGVIPVDWALRLPIYALLIALVAVGVLAVRRVGTSRWRRLAALVALGLVGVLVLALELAAHG
jgi:hypothetical protein